MALPLMPRPQGISLHVLYRVKLDLDAALASTLGTAGSLRRTAGTPAPHAVRQNDPPVAGRGR